MFIRLFKDDRGFFFVSHCETPISYSPMVIPGEADSFNSKRDAIRQLKRIWPKAKKFDRALQISRHNTVFEVKE